MTPEDQAQALLVDIAYTAGEQRTVAWNQARDLLTTALSTPAPSTIHRDPQSPQSPAEDATNYEYGVVHRQGSLESPHRTGLDRDGAISWVRSWDEETAKRAAYRVVRRMRGCWEEDPTS